VSHHCRHETADQNSQRWNSQKPNLQQRVLCEKLWTLTIVNPPLKSSQSISAATGSRGSGGMGILGDLSVRIRVGIISDVCAVALKNLRFPICHRKCGVQTSFDGLDTCFFVGLGGAKQSHPVIRDNSRAREWRKSPLFRFAVWETRFLSGRRVTDEL
jgi:hypothetical protein